MSHHLTWNNFQSTIIRPGQNRKHHVSTDPFADVFADDGGARIGVVIERRNRGGVDQSLCRLLRLEVTEFSIAGKPALQVTCSQKRFFREAYLLFTAMIDRVLEESADPGVALADELSAMATLMEEQSILSIQKQIGLFGELLVLEQFLKAGGAPFLECWTGPVGEAHDFRISSREFEVKSTVGRSRIHMINGLTQAVPSAGCKLFLISVLLAVAGRSEGRTLPDLVNHLASLCTALEHKQAFETGLAANGYLHPDAPSYTKRWKLRAPMAVIPVDKDFPAITPQSLEPVLGATFGRLEDISYKVNLDNAGRLTQPDLAAQLHFD